MKQFSILLYIVISFLFLSSCEKEIEVKLPPYESKIVVDGRIENGERAYVLLTRNAGFFSATDLNAIEQYVIKGATVTIDNGIKSEVMLPGSTVVAGLPDYLYISNTMLGEIGKTYTIHITTPAGEELTASSTIYSPIPLDSLRFKNAPEKDSLGFIAAYLREPGTTKNSYRWMARRIHKDPEFIPPAGSVFDDKYINGKSFEFYYNRGVRPNSQNNDDFNEERGYFKKGDTVIVKFSSISEECFNFFRAYETEVFNNGNPFAAPVSIPSNIKPKALGVWCAYGSWQDTVILK